MVNIVVAIGGTGSRVAEAYLHLAATGLTGVTKTFMFIVDKDSHCGNTQRLETAVNEYTDFRRCTGLSIPEIEKKSWCIDAAMIEICGQTDGDTDYRTVALNKASAGDDVILDLFHSNEEQEFQLKYGFYGHPSLGAAIYNMITNTRTFVDPNANLLFSTVRNQLGAGEVVHVFLIGSVFGGTGASLFPNVAKSLNEAFGSNPNFKQAGCLMLPYFTFNTEVNGIRKTVSPDSFLQKTAVALADYAQDTQLVRVDNNQRGDPSHSPAAFDALYLMGLLPLKNTCPNYALGGEAQIHSFSIVDMYAGLAAAEFFNDATANIPDGHPRLYTADLPTSEVTWAQVPNAQIREKSEQMIRFCNAFMSVLYPMFMQDNASLRDYVFLQNLYGYEGFISRRARLPEGVDLGLEVSQIAPYCLRYIEFWNDIQSNLGGSLQCNFFGAEAIRQCFLDYCNNDGSLNNSADFRQNMTSLIKNFKPNDLIIDRNRAGISTAFELQQFLNRCPLDTTNYRDLQPIYRAAYNAMK